MISAIPPQPGAFKPATLASYENAYAVGVQMRRETGRPHFVLRTGDPSQPFRVTSAVPAQHQTLLTLIA